MKRLIKADLPDFKDWLKASPVKNVYRVSTEQHVDMKSDISRSKSATILQARCASALSCTNIWKSSYPHIHV